MSLIEWQIATNQHGKNLTFAYNNSRFVLCNGIEQLALDPIANWLFLRSGFEELKVSISYSSSRVRTRRFLPLIRGEYDVETVVPMPIAV